MSIPFEGLVNFNLTSDNEYWSPLQEATRFHLKSRDRYEDLLVLCKSKGVKFVDIKRHLLNEAKKCGLYTRSMWSDTQKAMVYRTWSDLLACKYSWVIALNNFMTYTKKYKDYDIRVDRVEKKHQPVSTSKKTVIRKTTDENGSVKEVKTETIETTSPDSTKQEPDSTIIAPIQQDLTPLQIQTVIFKHLDVLGAMCKQKGPDVLKTFNLLMSQLGVVEFIVE
jgi:hypothetical protein